MNNSTIVKQQIARLVEENTALRGELTATTRRMKQLVSERSSQEVYMEHLRQQIGTLQTEMQHLRESLHALASARATGEQLGRQLAGQRQRADQLERDRDVLLEQCSIATARAEVAEQRCERLERAVSDGELRQRDSEEQLAQALDVLDEIQRRLQDSLADSQAVDAYGIGAALR